MREQVSKTFDVEDIQDRAAILLQDPEGLWSYGETNLNLCSNQAKQVRHNLIQHIFKQCMHACCLRQWNLFPSEKCNVILNFLHSRILLQRVILSDFLLFFPANAQVKGKEDLQVCCTPMANLQGDVQKVLLCPIPI